MKKIILWAVLVTISVGLGQNAMGGTPWQWEMTVQEMKFRDIVNRPTAIFPDAESERYYVVDGGRNRLLSFDMHGKFISAFTADNSLLSPFDMVREPGTLWVVEKGRNTLTRIDLEAKKINPMNISYEGRKIYPDRLEVHGNILYILDKGRGEVFSLDAEAKVQNRFACRNCEGGFVDFKVHGNKLWALEQREKSVYRFALDGALEAETKLDPATVDFPRSLEVDEHGLFFILDRHRGTVNIYDGTGKYLYSFLGLGQARGNTYYPIEIKFDPWGRLCVVDEGNGRIQIFSRK